LSYEVGSNNLVEGLDEALTGLSAGESKEFPTQLRAGDHGGEAAQATVTVRTVKEKDVPALDDDFAQTASEFDTIAELRADLRDRLTRVKALTQGVQARDRVLEKLLELVDVPMPEHVLHDEVTYREQEFDRQLEAAGLTREVYAEAEGKPVDELTKEIEDNARHAIRAQFVLEAIARKEELSVDEADLTDQIVRRAAQAGVRADAYAQQLVNSGQLGAVMSDILRGKALALVMEKASITDESGRPVDLDALTGTADETAAEAGETADTGTDEPAEASEAAAEPDSASDGAE
jgi:trigger factor